MWAAVVLTGLLPLLAFCLLHLWRFLVPSTRLEKGTVAFFHPFADGGGGGERVLWCAVAAVHQACPECRIKIYVRAGPTAEELVQDAASRFHIDVAPARIAVVPLTQAHLLLPERYPRLTLLRQALGSVLLAREALQALTPQVFIDTTGWAFTYPLARLAGCRVACYVHYPTISTNMLDRVWAQQAGYNNDAAIAGSGVKTLAKWLYYQLLALVYGLAGSCAHVVMVNSRWTKAHIDRLWWARGRPAQLVHPPVDTEQLQQLPLDRRLKRLFLVSVQQFRPEKNHALQLEAWALARRNAAAALAGGGGQSGSGGGLSPQAARAVLVATVKMVGSCRNDADRGRLAALQRQADDLGLGTSVEWHVNVPFDELKAMLGGAVGGLHTMVDEHFGISVVEYMAAGVIPIAHDSGGPKEDIVVPLDLGDGSQQITGFLASSLEGYAEAITKVLAMDQRDRLHIAAAAQQQARRFSTGRFHQAFTDCVAPILPEGTDLAAPPASS